MSLDATPTDEQKPKKNRRDRKQKQAAAPMATQQEGNGGNKSLVRRIRDYAVDSYNGIFKIVIQPQLPKWRVARLMLLSFVFGMFWAYVLAPVVFFNAEPSQMSQGYRDRWLILVASSYPEVYDQGQVEQLLGWVERPAQNIDRLLASGERSAAEVAALQEIRPIAENVRGTNAPRDRGLIVSLFVLALAIVLFYVLINVIALLWGLLIGGFVDRFMARFRPETEADRQARQAIEAIKERKRLEVQMKAEAVVEAAASTFGPPIMQRVSVYQKGRAFDDSFAIEDANDMFLGECGATIAKTIGDTQELAAVEIWLFDKEDFVRTLTKVFVSEYVYNDPVARSELDGRVDNPGTDIVLVMPGAALTLETGAIRLQAKVADVNYGSDPALPPNSYFQNLTLRMEAWEKSSVGVPAPMTAPAYAVPAPAPAAPTPMPAYQPPAYAPPPAAQPAYTPPPGAPFGGPMRPAAPPPGIPDEDEDDPFGGTGDFTPLGRP
jgi:hypothetical protein